MRRDRDHSRSIRRLRRRRLERLLAERRRHPSETAVRLAARLAPARPRSSARARVAVAAAVAVILSAALGALGGLGYAAALASQAVEKAVRKQAPQAPYALLALNAGGDQYRPGYGWGDPNHNHTGPPGLKISRAVKPRLVRFSTGAVDLFARILVDEQAALRIHVLDPRGRQIPLVQTRSVVDATKLRGRQSKVIRFTVLVPRVITLRLRLPQHLARLKGVYRLRVFATDPTGGRSALTLGIRNR